MMSPLLINRADIVTYIDFATQIPDAALNRFILEAQNGEFAWYIGADLYYELVQNYQDSGDYQTLFEGTTYEKVSGYTRYFHGLKPLLVYCAQMVYLKSGQVASTASGIVKKEKENSSNLTKEQLNKEIDSCYGNIAKYYREAVLYLEEYSSAFLEWHGAKKLNRLIN